ncbi:hypothetical protein HOA55_00705 [archaeon]|jgi:hypothetical protein|nr:hypothetical protein [archaeon]MBT3578224.1 hypothetical protein [archaeon]MBT6819855.1 hypothetical protein [archaeon]MBT6955742.1 hypothetical protein [archaeon]MBT7025637.1 hypothetical protein [archaeon]
MVGFGIDLALQRTQELLSEKPKGFEKMVEEIHGDYLEHRELIRAEAECFPDVRRAQSEYEFLYAKFDAALV